MNGAARSGSAIRRASRSAARPPSARPPPRGSDRLRPVRWRDPGPASGGEVGRRPRRTSRRRGGVALGLGKDRRRQHGQVAAAGRPRRHRPREDPWARARSRGRARSRHSRSPCTRCHRPAWRRGLDVTSPRRLRILSVDGRATRRGSRTRLAGTQRLARPPRGPPGLRSARHGPC